MATTIDDFLSADIRSKLAKLHVAVDETYPIPKIFSEHPDKPAALGYFRPQDLDARHKALMARKEAKKYLTVKGLTAALIHYALTKMTAKELLQLTRDEGVRLGRPRVDEY